MFLITAPLSLGLFVLREPFVLALIGERWLKVRVRGMPYSFLTMRQPPGPGSMKRAVFGRVFGRPRHFADVHYREKPMP